MKLENLLLDMVIYKNIFSLYDLQWPKKKKKISKEPPTIMDGATGKKERKKKICADNQDPFFSQKVISSILGDSLIWADRSNRCKQQK